MKMTAQSPPVLVVDDAAPIRMVELRILQAGGYNVMAAAGAREALGILDDGIVPDVLIADLDMPDMSGEEMVRGIHAARPSRKVRHVTGNIDKLVNARSLIWEGEAFLDKPFTANGLLEAVALLLTQGTVTTAARSQGAYS